MYVDHPEVTIILLSFNHQNFIDRSIKSVLNQTYKYFKLIVSDDGSLDNSKLIIESYRFNNLVTIDFHKNLGVAGNLNYSVNKYADTKYVCFIASDDYWPINRVERQVEFMEKNPSYSFCYGKYHSIDLNDEILASSSSINFSGNIFDKLISRSFSLPTPTLFYRTDALKRILPVPENIATEDIYLNLMIAKLFEGGFLNEFLSFYRQHNTNLSKKTYEMYQGHKIVLDLFSKDPLHKKYIRKHHLRWFALLALKYKKDARKYLFSATKYCYKKEYWVGVLRLLNLHN